MLTKDALKHIISIEIDKGKLMASTQEKHLKSLLSNSPASETIQGVSESRDLAVHVLTESLKRSWSAKLFLSCYQLFIYNTLDDSVELSDFVRHYILEKLDGSVLQEIIQ